MSENYFRIDAAERIWGDEIRVYGTKKEKREQGSYQKAARVVELCEKTGIKKVEEEGMDYSVKNQRNTELCSPVIYKEIMKFKNLTLEERQDQITFQKKIQESKAQRIRMLEAYEGKSRIGF